MYDGHIMLGIIMMWLLLSLKVNHDIGDTTVCQVDKGWTCDGQPVLGCQLDYI